jgi:hypothetical protein
VKVIREVIHAEIRSAVEVIRQEDQDWKVGVGVMGTYWALLDLCEARKNRLFEWLDICNLMSQNCLTNPNQL